jgi:hypothetical protein
VEKKGEREKNLPTISFENFFQQKIQTFERSQKSI